VLASALQGNVLPEQIATWGPNSEMIAVVPIKDTQGSMLGVWYVEQNRAPFLTLGDTAFLGVALVSLSGVVFLLALIIGTAFGFLVARGLTQRLQRLLVAANGWRPGKCAALNRRWAEQCRHRGAVGDQRKDCKKPCKQHYEQVAACRSHAGGGVGVAHGRDGPGPSHIALIATARKNEGGNVSHKCTIRGATQNDLDLLLRWGRALHEVEHAFEPQLTFEEDQARERYGESLQDPQTLFLIAELAAQPVGYLYAYIVDAPPYFATQATHCIIEVVYLEPQARERGVAQALIGRCSEWARAAGASRLLAGIYAANEPSVKLFTKQGFIPYHVTLVHDLDDHNR